MGTGVSRIEQEFILASVQEKAIPVQVHGTRQEATGRIDSVSADEVVIALDAPIKTGREERLRVFFSYFGHVMTFLARVRSMDDKRLVVSYPRGVYKNLQRKYERVPPPTGVRVYFVLENERVELNFPKSEEYNPADKPQYSDKFDPASLGRLVATFRESVSTRCSESRITMFRDRAPSGFEEEIMTRTGRMVVIPSSDAVLSELERRMADRVVSRAALVRERAEAGLDLGGRSFAAIQQEKRGKGILSELYCPILFHQYVVGCIYLVCTERAMDLDAELVEYVHQFSEVLDYSLSINNYFQGAETVTERFDAEIVNLSASGVLFTHDAPSLKEKLVTYADLPLVLEIGERKISLQSRIMRKYEDATTCYYGVQFLDVKPEDFRFLFDFVYGKKFTKEDSELWEGGAAPPPITL